MTDRFGTRLAHVKSVDSPNEKARKMAEDALSRLSAELEAGRKGPLVIKERVRSIGGELAVESALGRGARLEITFPQKVYG